MCRLRVQVDVLGNSIMDFAHPCDHEEIFELLNDKSYMTATEATLALVSDLLVTKHRMLFVRMKCTLTTKGRNINIKSAAYRVCTFLPHMNLFVNFKNNLIFAVEVRKVCP